MCVCSSASVRELNLPCLLIVCGLSFLCYAVGCGVCCVLCSSQFTSVSVVISFLLFHCFHVVIPCTCDCVCRLLSCVRLLFFISFLFLSLSLSLYHTCSRVWRVECVFVRYWVFSLYRTALVFSACVLCGVSRERTLSDVVSLVAGFCGLLAGYVMWADGRRFRAA